MLIERTRWVGGMLLAGAVAAWAIQLFDGEGWGSRTVVQAMVLGCIFWAMAFVGPVLREQAWKPSSELFWSWFVPEGLLLASFLAATHRALTLSGGVESPWIMLATLPFFAAVGAAGAHQPVEKAGWHVLRPPIGLFVLALAGTLPLIGVVAAGGAAIATGAWEELELSGRNMLFAASILAVAAGGAIYAWQVFLTRLAYGPEGVRYSRPLRVEIFGWHEVERLRRGWLGPYLRIDGGRRVHFPDHLRGLEWFAAELHERGIDVDI